MRKSFVCETGNKRVLDFLSDMLAFVPLSTLKKQLRLKEIRVNSKKINENILLEKNDEVSIFLAANQQKDDTKIDIIYSDENIVVIDKPILCDVENHLVSILQKTYPSIKAVHRLDRNTSGVLVFALTNDSYEQLTNAFKKRTVIKEYVARVHGVVKEDKEILKAYIKKDAQKNISEVSLTKKEGSSQIITEYQVIERQKDTTLLRVTLHTGKTHQIRAHLAFINHPIVGDLKYGTKHTNTAYQHLYADKLTFFGLKDELSYLNYKDFKRKNIDY